MKKLLLITAILALVMLPVGCENIEDTIRSTIEDMLEDLTGAYTIKVSGNIGANFTGEYEVVSAAYDEDTRVDLSTDSHSVDWEIPSAGYTEYAVSEAVSVAAMFQKQDEHDALPMVEIWKGDKLVDASEPELPRGAVPVVAFSSSS